MKRVLVTGATGFCGSHLARHLVQAGTEVHLLVRPSSVVPDWPADSRPPVLHEYAGSLGSVQDAVRRCDPETTFHLAALSLAEHTEEDLLPLLQANLVLGTQLVESLSGKNSVFINTGTFWQYGEDGHYRPNSLYAATKQAFADILEYYVIRRSLPAVTLRLFDTYGPADKRKRLFFALRHASESNTPVAMTPGEQRLDLVYIDDVVNAFLHAAAARRSGSLDLKEYAVTTESLHSLREIVDIFQEVAGLKLDVRWGAKDYAPLQVMNPWIKPKLPGWQPRMGLRAGIAELLAREPLSLGARGR